jgi:hypothetical protein
MTNMHDEPFIIDRFAVVPDEEAMQNVIDGAAEGNWEEQKIQRGLQRWTLLYRQGKADCVCCSQPIVDEMNIGAYFICFSEHGDQGFAHAFCLDCASEHDDVDSFVAAGLKGMRRLGVVMTPLVPAGQA